MRCPNCGNENPPDYTFCDECGARLVGDDIAAMSGTTEADTGGGGGGVSATSMQDQAGSDMGSAMSNYVDYGMGTGQSMPSATDMGADDPYLGSDTSASATGSDEGMGLSAMPVTEDTMGDTSATPGEAPAMPDVIKPLPSLASSDNESTATPAEYEGSGAGSSAYEDAQEALLGPADDARMSVEEGISSITGIGGSAAAISSLPEAGYGMDEEAVPVPVAYTRDTGDAHALEGAAGNEWAANALDLLNRAQDAVAGGDWLGFGELMRNLRSALQTASGGAPSSLSHPRRIEPVVSLGAGSGMPGLDEIGAASPSAGIAGTSGTDSDSTTMSGATSYEAPPVPPLGSQSGADPGYMGASQPADTMDSDMSGAGMPSGPISGEAPGNPPPTVTPMAAAAPQAAPAASGARLILISTGAEMALPEQEEITVGREDPSSGIFPDVDLTPHGGEDGGVSRRHARLLHVGGDYFVEDLQ
ncbi:MAG: zinc-ribbon domain-containing protein, partial [Chloroflexia bacterium]